MSKRLGDEASFSESNAIYIRKGLLTIQVRVGGGDRDRAVHDDAARRVNALAKLVAGKLEQPITSEPADDRGRPSSQRGPLGT